MRIRQRERSLFVTLSISVLVFVGMVAAIFVLSFGGWWLERWVNWRFHHGPMVEQRLESIEQRIEKLEKGDADS
jgi:hypothetical protein